MSASSPNNRQHLRKPLRTSALLSAGNLPTLTVRTLDIGLGGMGIVASANFVSRARCSVLMTLPTRDYGAVRIKVEAAVAHCIFSGNEDGFKVGLQFTALTAEAEADIARYLSY